MIAVQVPAFPGTVIVPAHSHICPGVGGASLGAVTLT